MTPVKTIEEFYRYNHEELKKCVRYITKIKDDEEINDKAQNFYLRLIKSHSLEKYTTNGGRSFNTYIWQMLFWMLAEEFNNQKNKFNDRAFLKENVAMTTHPSEDRAMDLEESVWSKVGEFDGNLRVDPSIKDSFATVEKSKEILSNLDSFKKYLMSLKEKDKRKDRMIRYIELKDTGLNGTEIAEQFEVSDTMVKDIRKHIQGHYMRWSKKNNKTTYAV